MASAAPEGAVPMVPASPGVPAPGVPAPVAPVPGAAVVPVSGAVDCPEGVSVAGGGVVWAYAIEAKARGIEQTVLVINRFIGFSLRLTKNVNSPTAICVPAQKMKRSGMAIARHIFARRTFVLDITKEVHYEDEKSNCIGSDRCSVDG